MKILQFVNRTCILLCGLLFFTKAGKSQDNSFYITPLYGVYSYSYNQVPQNLVVQGTLPAEYGLQWEKSSIPVEGYVAVAGATGSVLSQSSPISQTAYYRLKLTNGASIIYSNQVKLELVSINWENVNYVRTHDLQVQMNSTDWMLIDQLPIGSKIQSTTYLDGLGRPIQQISRETATPPEGSSPSATWGDVVQFTKFDALGRQVKSYLPYSTNTESGRYKTTHVAEQAQYFLNVYNETYPFSSATFDNSPLNRTINVKSPGTSWGTSTGNSSNNNLNTATENIRIFTIGYTTGDKPATSAAYPDKQLLKVTNTDENGNQVISYTNTRGQMVLTKTQLDAAPSIGHTGWICVYYVYDDFGRLRSMIQPEAVKWLEANGWSFAGTAGQEVFDNLCFRYEYDEKGRTVLKKAPGAKELLMLYDSRDRVVFMQDGNQRQLSPPEWTANLYDELDRPVTAVLYRTSKSVATLNSDIANAPDVVNITLASPNATIATYKTPLTAVELNNAAVATIIKVNHYDHYNFATVKPFNTAFENYSAYSSAESDAITKTDRTLNMPTGSITRVLETNTFLSSTVYYDEKGRVLQSLDDNIKTATDVTTMQYNYFGRLLSTHTRHSATGTAYTNFSILNKNVFDKLGRIISLEKKIGTNPFKVIGTYSYDDMGRLLKKRLAPGYTGTGKTEIETLAYSYNIHNNITGINKNYALKTGGTYTKWGNFFGLYLGYDNRDNVFTGAQLDGQVTGLLWNTQGDDAQRKYDYTYDRAGRLINAAFAERQLPSGGWSNNKMDFGVSGNAGKITYDLNGNLLNMLQKGVVPGVASPITIDNLTYYYATNSNKLLKVNDNGTAGTNNGKFGDFKDGTNPADDYVYDDNGNLVIDLNKNVKDLPGLSGGKGIKYNFLDKPVEIRIAGKGTIKIVYDADGNKIQRIFTPEAGGTAVTTSYINEFVYRENELQFISFEEGRIRNMQAVSQNNSFDMLTIDGNIDLPGSKRGAWDYFIRDYQGNVRMILTEELHTGSNACTMETNRDANEAPLFGEVDANGNPTANNEVRARFSVANIPGQSMGNGWTNPAIGQQVIRLGNFAGKKVGPNALLRVMGGDEVSASTIYYYQNPVVNNNNGNGLLGNIVSALMQAISGSTATAPLIKDGAGNITSTLNGSLPFSTATSPDAYNPAGDNPKAYLTVLFFDERFNFVEEGSTALRVQIAGNGAAPLVLANIKAPKNGYAYIYVSNESDEHVYFDNLQVSQVHGRITEENHYYAYGLKIAGISSKKLGDINEGSLKNDYLYNDKELWDDADLNWYDYGFRNYDPQIGRFPQLDPLTSDYPELTNYQYASCEPIANIDLDGLEKLNAVSFAYDYVVPSSSLVFSAAPKVATYTAAKAGEQLIKQAFKAGVRQILVSSGTAAATIALTVIPLQAGPGLGPNGYFETEMMRKAVGSAKASLNPIPDQIVQRQENVKPAHGNRSDNPNEHIVYTLYGVNRFGLTLLKYGISDFTKWKFKRPESQKSLSYVDKRVEKALIGKFTSITYSYRKFPNRLAALYDEVHSVSQYYKNNNQMMPPMQLRPAPMSVWEFSSGTEW